MKDPVIFDSVLLGSFSNPAGPLALVLENVGRRIVVQAQIHIGRQVPSFYRSTWRNAPPGPPMLRSGVLQSSLTITPATLGPQGLEVSCIAPAVNPRDSAPYGKYLIDRGYEFVDLKGVYV